VNPPSGCRFNPRCQLRAQLGGPEICVREEPPLVDLGGTTVDHRCACHFRGPGSAAAQADVVRVS
jgi:peptide/nickel transport system ATP-binding protein